MPDELKELTWIEELLIARAHVIGRAVWFQARNPPSAGYHAPPCSFDDACVIAQRGPPRMDWKIRPRRRPALFTVHSLQERCI